MVACFGHWCALSAARVLLARGTAWRLLFRCGAVGSFFDFCQLLAGVWEIGIVCARPEEDDGVAEESWWLLVLQRTVVTNPTWQWLVGVERLVRGSSACNEDYWWLPPG